MAQLLNVREYGNVMECDKWLNYSMWGDTAMPTFSLSN